MDQIIIVQSINQLINQSSLIYEAFFKPIKASHFLFREPEL